MGLVNLKDFEVLNLHPRPVGMEPGNWLMESFISVGNSFGVQHCQAPGEHSSLSSFTFAPVELCRWHSLGQRTCKTIF